MYWKQSRIELSSSVFGLFTYKGQTFSTGAFFVGASTLAVSQRSTLTRFPKIGDFDMFQWLFFRFKHGILFSSSRRSKWAQQRTFWTLLLDTAHHEVLSSNVAKKSQLSEQSGGSHNAKSAQIDTLDLNLRPQTVYWILFVYGLIAFLIFN